MILLANGFQKKVLTAFQTLNFTLSELVFQTGITKIITYTVIVLVDMNNYKSEITLHTIVFIGID
jgi:hypothetical protein